MMGGSRPVGPDGDVRSITSNDSCLDGEASLVIDRRTGELASLGICEASIDCTLVPLGAVATNVSCVKKLAVLGCVPWVKTSSCTLKSNETGVR